jgi:hypothetical protein
VRNRRTDAIWVFGVDQSGCAAGGARCLLVVHYGRRRRGTAKGVCERRQVRLLQLLGEFPAHRGVEAAGVRREEERRTAEMRGVQRGSAKDAGDLYV